MPDMQLYREFGLSYVSDIIEEENNIHQNFSDKQREHFSVKGATCINIHEK